MRLILVNNRPANLLSYLEPFPSNRGVLVKLSLLTRVSLRGEPLNAAVRNLASKTRNTTHTEPFRRGSSVWQTDRQTYRIYTIAITCVIEQAVETAESAWATWKLRLATK